jgi:hypothetical protein
MSERHQIIGRAGGLASDSRPGGLAAGAIRRAQFRARAESVLEELQFLLSCGEALESAAARVGYPNVDSLERALTRWRKLGWTDYRTHEARTPDRSPLDGRIFGRLTVLHREGSHRDGGTTWRCKCECGNETVVLRNSLTAGQTKSCGCYKRDQKRQWVQMTGFRKVSA